MVMLSLSEIVVSFSVPKNVRLFNHFYWHSMLFFLLREIRNLLKNKLTKIKDRLV